MKNKKIIAALLLAGFVFTACEDGLDDMPISQSTVDNAYTSGDQIEAALTGVYESFQGNDYYVWDHVLFSDVRSDNHYAGGDNPDIFQIDAINIQNDNPRVFNAWSAIYNAIAKANVVLDKAPQVSQQITVSQV